MRISKFLRAYFFLIPATLLILFVLGYPILRGIYIGFTRFNPLESLQPMWIGLRNYQNLLTDNTVIRSFSLTGIWIVVTVSVQFMIGFCLALLLNLNFRGRDIYRALIFIPWVVPTISAASVWRWMYNPQYGVINQVFQQIGLISSDVMWLGDARLALPAVMVVAIWKHVPFVMVVLLSGLQSISKELYEAASIDGANAWSSFVYITLPQLRSVITVVLLLTTIWASAQFDLPWVMASGGPARSTTLVTLLIYAFGLQSFWLGYAASLANIVALVLAVIILFWLKIQSRRADIFEGRV